MKYQLLGNSDLEVSRVCLGTMTYGEQNSQEEAFEQMDFALESGVNFFDTAEMYSVPGRPETCGETERIIGRWLLDRGTRDQVKIATKVVGYSPGLKYIRNGPDFSKDQINQAIEGSLRNLQTDHVDLYQLHWPRRGNNKFGVRLYPYQENEGYEHDFLDSAQTMNELIQAGKIKHWGISNETAWGAMKYIQLCKDNGLIAPVSVQNAYGLLNRQFEYGMSEVCQFEGMGLMAYSPLAFGALSGKYLDGMRPEGARLSEYHIFNRFLNPRAMEATKAYQVLAEEQGLTVVQLALAFVYQQPFAHTTIIGATKMQQLRENIEAEKIELSQEVLNGVNAIFNEYPDPAL